MRIVAKRNSNRQNVVWNHVGTIVTMGSNLILVPFAVVLLDRSELGLWYTYVAVANLTLLFEFGFAPTFARNLVYALRGAQDVASVGAPKVGENRVPNWELFAALIRTAKRLYAVLSLVVGFLCGTLGTIYVAFISDEVPGTEKWIAWGCMVASVILNMYFFYTTTLLRGIGDIAAENKAHVASRFIQLVVSVTLMAAGLGIVGASIGYLASGFVLRFVALRSFARHDDVIEGLRGVGPAPIRYSAGALLCRVATIAWKDGLVQLASFGATQCAVLIVSAVVGLGPSGEFSIALQLGNALCNFASAYVRSYYPEFQAAFINDDRSKQKNIVARGVIAYLGTSLSGMLVGVLCAPPALTLIKPTLRIDPVFLALMLLYLIVWTLHSIYCNFIVSMNEIPYWSADLVASGLGVLGAWLAGGPLKLGMLGIVVVLLLVQMAYNAWYWTRYVHRRLDFPLLDALKQGVAYWRSFLGSRKRG